MTAPRYRGRFAPSPSGPLHFGSLVAAVASYADARHHDGEWLLRIDDVDQVRCRSGAEQSILDTLDAFGMHADAKPIRQSECSERYLAILDRLIAGGHAYRCNCSRKQIARIAKSGSEGPIYPGTCRQRPPPDDASAAWRVRVPAKAIAFDDRVAGEISQDLARDIGDFVLHRTDGFAAYQLAVVVDDHDQKINQVVRGADLLWSTPRQIWLQQLLGFPTPAYAHIPLVYDPDGRKLSKSDKAHPVDPTNPVGGLRAAWKHLGQTPAPEGLHGVDAFWAWAISSWDIRRVPADREEKHESRNSL